MFAQNDQKMLGAAGPPNVPQYHECYVGGGSKKALPKTCALRMPKRWKNTLKQDSKKGTPGNADDGPACASLAT